MKTLVTGAAGFIGFHTSKQMLELGHEVIGLDNINDYYDVNLKNNRLKILQQYSNMSAMNTSICTFRLDNYYISFRINEKCAQV